jgi:hypothetical protein
MASNDGPATIYLIRHGEKLGDPGNDKDGGPYLSAQGCARAAALPSLFVPTPSHRLDFPSFELAGGNGGKFTTTYEEIQLEQSAAGRFHPPGFIFAAKPDGSSEPPSETITPLATALGLTPNTQYSNEDFGDVASTIKSQKQYAGGIVLICWHHGNIPALAEAIGVQGPPNWEWPSTVFDQIWQIDYATDPSRVAVHYEALLYGDTAPS